VPAAPIFIPAAQIRQERAQRQSESQMDRNPERSIPLTAELLAQRWGQALGS
jgi:hypothetical protein